MKIRDKFKPQNALSKGFDSHIEGDVPFITNGFYNNGIQGFVTPLPRERIFNEKAICVSAFCEATVQKAPFLPRGNGGSGLIVLTPLVKMSDSELYYYAAQINHRRWRFSYGRMVTSDRLAEWDIIEPPKGFEIPYKPTDLVPDIQKKTPVSIENIKEIPLPKLCTIERRYAPYMNQVDLIPRRTPYVTTTENNNGIAMKCNEDPLFEKGTVTISLDGICGTAFFQFDNFIAGEKTAVLRVREGKNPYLLFYIAAMVRLRSWRYHYGRKLSMGRLEQMSIPVPVNKTGSIDSGIVKKLVENSYGSNLFEKYKV